MEKADKFLYAMVVYLVTPVVSFMLLVLAVYITVKAVNEIWHGPQPIQVNAVVTSPR